MNETKEAYMATTKGKKPTNKDRDKAIRMHEQAIRDIIPKFNGLYNQVQDFFAVFSMFVEMMGKDEEFGEYVKCKIKEAEEVKNEKTPEIVGPDGKPVQSAEVTIPADKVVAENS